ncbi:hypothetical protein BDB00DRAFT_851900 [Zychaea mexicana]|uniref:uncharacterized protein n=1 Tax=Zychaea mexicana TaxID=64656 RepID=UPI0022FDE1B8|nr:uncharacterized protein BDB00DRAFT_851900 [Zychaea mexicana]KAI9485032.1 hypothetical protein BDB00DRAFT_851900 [Zychaea mexicana]
MSSESDQLHYWLEQEPVNTDTFLQPDTPTTLTQPLIRSRLDNLQKRHLRITGQLISQQKTKLSEFQAAFAERTDSNLFPPDKRGVFEFINGEQFLEENQNNVFKLLSELQVIAQHTGTSHDSIPLEKRVAENVDDTPNRFANDMKAIYESELDDLRGRQKDLFREFLNEYVEQKGTLQHELARIAAPLPSHPPTAPAATLPAQAATKDHTEMEAPKSKRLRFTTPLTQPRHHVEPPSHPVSTSPPRRMPVPPQLSRDPRLRNDLRTAGGGRPPEVSTAPRANRPPDVATATRAIRPANLTSAVPPVVKSSSASPKPKLQKAPQSLLDIGTMDMVGADVYLVERQSKIRIRLGVAKDFDDALHAPSPDCPLYVRYSNGEQWFHRKRDSAKIGSVAKIQPMIHKYLLQT